MTVGKGGVVSVICDCGRGSFNDRCRWRGEETIVIGACGEGEDVTNFQC